MRSLQNLHDLRRMNTNCNWVTKQIQSFNYDYMYGKR